MYSVAVANNSWRKHHYLRESCVAFNSGKHYCICVYSIYVYVVGTSKVVRTNDSYSHIQPHNHYVCHWRGDKMQEKLG